MRPARTERDVTVALAVSPFYSLVFHSAYIGGMNAPLCNDFLAQTRQNLDPDEEVILFYDGTSKSRHSRGQYQAGDAPGLQPIPEQSGAGNRLTEGSDKKRRIEARNTSPNGRQSGGQTPRYSDRRLLPDALQRSIRVITAAKANKWFRFMQTYLPRCLNGE